MLFIRILGKPEHTVHIRAVHTHSVSDVGDVKGEIAFLGPLLHFKGLAQGLCDVCFERIASCLPGIWGNLSICKRILLYVTYLLKNKNVLRAFTVASCRSYDKHTNAAFSL